MQKVISDQLEGRDENRASRLSKGTCMALVLVIQVQGMIPKQGTYQRAWRIKA